jgi:ankyrin repeat domain-containing protein 50
MYVRFRWAALQLDSLSNCRSMTAIHKKLSSIPSTLDETYSRILESIDPDEKPRVLRMLHWICFSVRLMHLGDLATVYLVGGSIQPPFHMDNAIFHVEDIIGICRGLLMVVELDGGAITSSHANDGLRGGDRLPHSNDNQITHIVQLSHFSVKEYLTSSSALSWRLHDSESHVSIIRTCIAVYLHAISSEMTLERVHFYQIMKEHPLANYAMQFMYLHLDLITPREHPNLSDSFRALLDPTPHSRPDRLALMYFGPTLKDVYPRIKSKAKLEARGPFWSLHTASRLGLTQTVQWLLSYDHVSSVINTTFSEDSCSDRSAPIVEAALFGHVDVVKLLIEAGADVNIRRRGSRTALQAAAANGNETTIRMLMDAGADSEVNLQGNYYWSTP